MRVAIICDYWKNSGGGGIKHYLINLVNHLDNENFEVKVLFREGNDPENIKINGSRFFFVIKSVVALLKLKPELIHTHEKWYFLLVGRIYKTLFNCKLIHTYHTAPSHEIPKLEKITFQTLVKGCDYVTFVSKDLVQQMYACKGIKCANPIITYGGVKSTDAENVSEEEVKKFRALYNLKNDSIVLLGSGLTANKLKAEGAKILIKSIVNLKVLYPEIMLLLTKDGIYIDDLKTFARSQGVSEHVVFTGDIENPFLPLKVCDIYTHTPLIEGGVSLALLEAMSVSKPIVATSIGGIPEVITDGVNGLLVDAKEEMIVQKVDFLLQNKDIARKMGINAKQTAKEKFTWRETANIFMELYSNA